MTQSGMPTRIAMPCPFAGADGAALGTIGLTSGDSINFPQGFPSVYGSPASKGGKYVKRAELNAVGNMATNDLFYHKCGGLNTFDQAFCNAIGGYPYGSILDFIDRDNYSLFKIISLIDNNKIVPDAKTIDNVSWAYLNVPDAKPSTDRSIAKFKLSGYSGLFGTNNPIGIFQSMYSGYLSISDSGGTDTYVTNSGDTSSYQYYGIGILAKIVSEENISNIEFPTYESVNGFKWITGMNIKIPNAPFIAAEKLIINGGGKPPTATITWKVNPSVVKVNSGDFVALTFICGFTVVTAGKNANTISDHEITISVI